MTDRIPNPVRDPEWLAHRHVESSDSLRFIKVSRELRGGVPFLTDDCLGEGLPMSEVPMSDCLANLPKPRICWLYHSAFCGSTMLTRAFDYPHVASSLSEPVVLNDVVGFRRRGAKPAAVARLADTAIRSLGRPFHSDEAVLIKPSNILNPLAELLLALQPSANAILLYAPLETFLVSVVRKGLPCRLWVRELLDGFLVDGFVDLPFATGEIFRMSDLQVAALGWLVQHRHFERLAKKLGPDRVRTLDADKTIASLRSTIYAAAQHWRLNLDEKTADVIASGPKFSQHSKSGKSFNVNTRDREYASAYDAHREEIDIVLAWTETIAKSENIPMQLSFGLNDQGS